MSTFMQQINRSKISDQIIEQILFLIEKKPLLIGSKLPTENEMMKQLGVGRSSLREAIRALSLIGVIEVKHGQGIYVTAFPESLSILSLKWRDLRGQEKVEKIVEARKLLENMIIQAVIEKANEHDIRELRAKFEQMQSVQDKRKEYVQADMAFHFEIAKASHNDILVGFLDNIRYMMRTWMEMDTPYNMEKAKITLEQEHRQILEAIESSDLQRAQLAINKHLENITW